MKSRRPAGCASSISSAERCSARPTPAADCEVIALGAHILRTLGIGGGRLRSTPSAAANAGPRTRRRWSNTTHSSKDRLLRNLPRQAGDQSAAPARLQIARLQRAEGGAPSHTDYLCGDCADHFAKVREGLDALGVDYAVNPFIVRGLDYYNRTVFEFTSSQIGAQSAVFGGGRYDGLGGPGRRAPVRPGLCHGPGTPAFC